MNEEWHVPETLVKLLKNYQLFFIYISVVLTLVLLLLIFGD